MSFSFQPQDCTAGAIHTLDNSIGSDFVKVSPKRCAALVEKSRAQGGDIAIKLYPGATHDFDDPGRKRQSVDGNAAAKADATAQAPAFFAEQLAVKR